MSETNAFRVGTGASLLSRRRFLQIALGSALGAAGAGLYAWRVEPHWVEVVRRQLPILNLPQHLVGKRLVQISDLHIGPVVHDGYLRSALRRVSRLRQDILVITGDFMTCSGHERVEHALKTLAVLRPANLATLAVLGNHDYGAGWRQKSVADRFAHGLRRLGIEVLRNDKRFVAGLTVAGVDDYWSPGFAPQKVIPTLAADEPALVLCHNPDVADLPVWAKYRGWILCGHTHGGQCRAPILGPPILPVQNKRYTAGEFALADGRRLYINRGLGYSRRVRFNARPEITHFTMRAA